MKKLFNNFTTSGFEFGKNEEKKKAKYQTLNVGIFLTTIALTYGIIGNIIRNIEGFIGIELSIIIVNIILLLSLRKYPRAFEFIVVVMVSQFTLLFILLVYISTPESMKFAWLFNYPMILIYLQNVKQSFYWMLFFVTMLLIIPLQNFVEVSFNLYQITYIIAILIIINAITYFYQLKMSEANTRIIQQQEELEDFNVNLENEIQEKISELQSLNELLEIKVEEKIEELRAKDKILEVQSKQAVMGEMISMIAHQWRQPLSTITLQIANLQFKKLLGQELSSDETDNALSEISDTIIYLSDTVDDFQTYFHPDKELQEIAVNELLSRAVNFAKSRVSKNEIEINLCENCTYSIKTYPNEFIQVVLNILNNAIDAHDECKTKNAQIKIDVNIQDDHLIVDISDNAGGIDEKNLGRLFEPYFSTKGRNGTGLGLYMSQMIVQKQFAGDLSVKTSKDGSTFTINIPKI